MKALIALILMCPAISIAVTVTQTDWSDGGGLEGPTVEWGTWFYGCEAANWSSSPGSLILTNRAFVEPTMSYVEPYYVGAGCIYAADLDGDGDADVICGSELDSRIDWWENSDTQPGVFVEQHTLIASVSTPHELFCIDLENDGDMDVLAVSDNGVFWWRNNGGGSSWTQYTLDTSINSGYGVHSADVDGDGDLDISAADLWNGDFLWYENLDSIGTSWSKHIVFGEYDGPSGTYLADIDGDGDIDMLGGGFGGISWFENMDGSGTNWTEHIEDTGFDFALSLNVLDLDGDGDPDFSGAAYSSNALAWWENTDGVGGIFEKHVITSSYVNPASSCPCDFDSDGDYDFLTESYGEDNVVIWENLDGCGEYWRKLIIWPNFNNPGTAFAADLNNDGYIDALASAYTGCEILWWEVSGEALFGYLESSILDAGDDPTWGNFSWNAITPPGTSVSLLLRGSDNYSDMGAWSDTLTAPGSLSGIIENGDSYLQYQVILETDTPGTSPVLEDISVSWNPVGISEEPELGVPGLSISPNPSRGVPLISYEINGNTPSEIIVFDLSGRVQYSMQLDPDYGRIGSIQIPNLIPGVYFCRLLSEENELSKSFVVLR